MLAIIARVLSQNYFLFHDLTRSQSFEKKFVSRVFFVSSCCIKRSGIWNLHITGRVVFDSTNVDSTKVSDFRGVDQIVESKKVVTSFFILIKHIFGTFLIKHFLSLSIAFEFLAFWINWKLLFWIKIFEKINYLNILKIKHFKFWNKKIV